MLTSFQSISIISQIVFCFNLTFSEVNVPVILNKWMLPPVLHNFIGVNNIILTAFENRCALNSFNFLDFIMIKIINPKIDKLSMKIVYHWILHLHSIYHDVSCVATTPTSFICCKARLVTEVLSFVCLHNIEINNNVTQ